MIEMPRPLYWVQALTCAAALTLTSAAHSSTAPAHQVFIHPGAMNNQADLDFVKAKIAAGQEPWATKFKDILWKATPYTKTVAAQDGAEGDQKDDAVKAYANALAWYYTGHEAYAQNAMKVLNVWARTFRGYTIPPVGQGGQSQLNAAWMGSLLAPAAEILRAYPKWSKADRALVVVLFKAKFYPILNQVSFYNGNNDLVQIEALMSMAVFNEDETEFKLGLERIQGRAPAYFYLASDMAEARNYGGSDASKWYSPLQWVDGLSQESCRDLGHHAQFGLAAAMHAAEIAWNQGVAVYDENATRYIAALELMARELLNGEARFSALCPASQTGQDETRKDDLFDTWQVGYNHYHNRMHQPLPYTGELIRTKIISGGHSDWNIFYETLTHNIQSAN